MVTHVGRGQAQQEMTAQGMTREEKLQFCRYYHDASDTSYDLHVPPRGLVNRAGGKQDDLEGHVCGWYIPTNAWPPGAEAALMNACAPWLTREEQRVEAESEKCESFQELEAKGLITAKGSLRAIRFCLSVSLCNAAAVPLSDKYELLDEEPIYRQASHPLFYARVFQMEEFASLAALVNKSQTKAEELRKGPPPVLTIEEFNSRIGELESSILSAVSNTATEAPASAVPELAAPTIHNAPSAAADTVATPSNMPATPTDSANGYAQSATTAAAPAAPGVTRAGTPRKIKERGKRIVESCKHYELKKKKKGMFYIQNIGLKTIKDIWNEYDEGLEGNHSLKWLNEYEPQWNKYGSARTAYSRRSGIYNMVINMITNGRTKDEAVAQLQIRLDNHPKKGMSGLTDFNNMLKKELKNTATEDV
jgi:hypothetical protein